MMNDGDATRGEHVLDRLQACVDGELPAVEAEQVRRHAAGCPACGRALAEAERVWAVLAACPAPAHPRPAWPGVSERLRARERSRWPFAAGAFATAAAGLLLGLMVGRTLPAGATAADESQALVTWTQSGSLLASGGAATLDSLFLAAGQSPDEDGEVRP